MFLIGVVNRRAPPRIEIEKALDLSEGVLFEHMSKYYSGVQKGITAFLLLKLMRYQLSKIRMCQGLHVSSSWLHERVRLKFKTIHQSRKERYLTR